ncbi:MAG: hypothetical protein Q9169_005116 [Polycauliona sp. 2 TL-2023]
MEIDLDSFFGGQGATDLDDDYEEIEPPTLNVDTTIAESGQTTDHHHFHARDDELFTRIMRDARDDNLIINAPGYQPPRHSQWKRDNAGKVVIWDDIKVARPVYQRSPLGQVECATIEEPMAIPVDTTTDDSASSSDTSSDTDTPPSSPESSWQPIEACPPLPLLSPPIDTTSLKDSATKSSDRRSGMYATIIIGISIILSLW